MPVVFIIEGKIKVILKGGNEILKLNLAFQNANTPLVVF